MVRAEEDENGDVGVPEASYGAAEPARGESSAADVFLYVPDASEETGWTTFRIRRNRDRRSAIGFGRRP